MRKETMTGRERWEAVLHREKPDRIPMDIWATEEAFEKLCRHLGCTEEEMLVRLHIDRPVGVEPVYVGPPIADDRDMWGQQFRMVDYGTGAYQECANAPLSGYSTIEELEADYVWPSLDWFDFSVLPKLIEGKEDRVIRGGGSEPFLLYKNLRGEEQAFMDLLLYPEFVHHCLDKLFDFFYGMTQRIFESIPGQVSITYVAEDLGGQEALMYSPEHIREFLLPRMKRMNELTKQNGSHVFFHSDGAVREILFDIAAIGAEVLNPIQWRCPGMEREGLKRDFGDAFVFHGGVDNQQTLPFGTPDDVRQEVAENIDILGKDGGYILAPCHNIQSVSSPENVIALYEAGYEAGWC
jgi:uroporphyrinogen decarboxylase